MVAVVIGSDGIDFRGAVFAEAFDIACNVIFELGDKTFDDFGIGIANLSRTGGGSGTQAAVAFEREPVFFVLAPVLGIVVIGMA